MWWHGAKPRLFERDLLRERARPAETGTDESKRRKRAP
jgi:hypothetical protein